MGLLRLLFIVAAVYLIFRIIGRYVLPWLMRYAVNKAGNQMKEQMKTRTEGEKIYQDEKVTIRRTQNKANGNGSSQDDEYVDFEEIKD